MDEQPIESIAPMKPSSNGLATRAFTQLTPDVFLHPVWIDFISKRRPFPSESVEKLLLAAQEQESTGDTQACCQILFMCAFLYHSTGEDATAFRCLEKIQELGKIQSLIQVVRWAAWAIAAFHFQQGEQEKAGEQLRWLRDDFQEAGDWVMSNTLELFRLSLVSQGERRDHLAFVDDWLRHWGEAQLNHRSTGQAVALAGVNVITNRRIEVLFRSIACYFRILWTALNRLATGATLQAVYRIPEKFPGVPGPESDRPEPAALEWQVEQDKISPAAGIAPSGMSPGDSLENHASRRLNELRPLPGEVALDSQSARPPMLAIYCLGPFRVFQDDFLVSNFPSGTSKVIFKYLVANHELPTQKEVLMEMFWQGVEPESARNNLNVAIYKLRKALRSAQPDFPHILFEEDHYQLNPDMIIWMDVEEFLERYANARRFEKQGQLEAMVRELEAAESLYQDDFLVEDPYEEWIIPKREGLKDIYLIILDRLGRFYLDQENYMTCIHICKQILSTDICREDAHRRLMRSYSRLGQPNLALQQYHVCKEALGRILEVKPMEETETLYRQIRERKYV